ncbi:Hypothetical protein, putative [Bodo saltans]|uniref:Uncharacterized protein n=2 Tax=Bodo saltans TaxID=75058 RepID=A0A0S4J8Z0_BODSA|nr:Hypothetical protein, putative [Bodo saltans]|eukprot:CUG85921.1 Hypothetical protein, putative [Bodo saltans]
MRRVCVLTSTATVAVAARTIIPGKGIVENRISRHYYNKTVEELKSEMAVKEAKHKHPSPQNKKEALAHLTRQCDHEYVADFQRAANDMMAVYSDPIAYSHDMAYHYHRITKVMRPSKSNCEDSNDSLEIVKLHPK